MQKTTVNCNTLQAEKSSQNFSTVSTRESLTLRSSNCTVAIYKGLQVDVYIVNKTEISLSRSDLIELINVRVSFIDFTQLFVHLFTATHVHLFQHCRQHFSTFRSISVEVYFLRALDTYICLVIQCTGFYRAT